MITLAICTAHVLGLAIGFYVGRMVYLPRVHSAELRSQIYSSQLQRIKLRSARTDAENAAGMVS